jgi:ribosome biogenesis GTPase
LETDMSLEVLGWNEFFNGVFESYTRQGLAPARVILVHKQRCVIDTGFEEVEGMVTGRFRQLAHSPSDYPTVGDWVAVDVIAGTKTARIHAVLPRKSAFSRTGAPGRGAKGHDGKIEEQVLAANVDICFLVSGLDGDLVAARMDRYLTLTWESGATPVLVLNKLDLCDDPDAAVAEMEPSALGTPILAVSAVTGEGMDALRAYLAPGRTAVFLGSSGTGKSSLINRLLGEERQRVQETRAGEHRGKHTTTYRELLRLPGSGLVIDTPGLRELRLYADTDVLSVSFADIEILAQHCRFNDCRHEQEPDCAVLAAVECGELRRQRLESYRKQRRELEFLALKRDTRSRRQEEKRVGRKMAKYIKEIKRYKPKLSEK